MLHSFIHSLGFRCFPNHGDLGPNDEVILESKQAGEWIRKDYPASKTGNDVLAGNMERIQSKTQKKKKKLHISKQSFRLPAKSYLVYIRDTNKVG